MPDTDRDQARIHLQVLGQQRTFLVDVPLGTRTLFDFLPSARGLSEQINGVVVEKALSEGQSISCRAGCGACCRQLVAISVVEARSLADLVASMPAERQVEIRRRFAEALRRLEEAGLLATDEEPGNRSLRARNVGDLQAIELDLGLRYFQQRIPCPFLENESCSIHPDRPMVCREYLVTTPAERCRHLFHVPVEHLPVPMPMGQVLMKTGHRLAGASLEMVPLVLSLEWTEAHGGDLDKTCDGMDLFRTMIGEIDQQFSKSFDERKA